MKTINKAAKEFAESEIMETYDSLIEELKRISFIYGAKFAQEWISVEDELPEIKEKPYQILVKTGNGHCGTMIITDNHDIGILKEYFTHWRPTERG